MERSISHGAAKARSERRAPRRRKRYPDRVAWLAAIATCALAAAPAPRALAQDAAVEEVVVTGTYLHRKSQADSPAPLVTITSDDLAARGANEVGRMLEALTINTGSQNNPDAFTQNFTTGTSNVNLRGLGVSSTLVLINGRRQTQSAVATDRGENFVDVSSLPPMIAFDRIEVLKNGAAALYGSEAVAGVVNFITRSQFEGLDLALGRQDIDGEQQDDAELGALYGVRSASGATHLLVAFHRLDREPLTTARRRLSRPTDDLSQAGNPGSFLVPALPGNPAYRAVWSAAFDGNSNGVADFVEPALGLPAVPGARPPVFADQSCATVAAQDAKVVPNISAAVPSEIGIVPIGLCELDFGGFYSLVPKERRDGAYAELTQRFNEHLDARLELHVANNEATRSNSPSFPFAAFPTIAANHPDNPYGTDVRFIGRAIGAGGTAAASRHDSATRRVAGSLRGSIGGAWTWEIGAQHSENDFLVAAADVLADRFELALRGLGGPSCNVATGTPGSGGCAYFNPFGTALTGTGTPNSPELLRYLVGVETVDAHSELTTVEGFAARELGALAGGPIALAAGAQYRGDAIAYDYDDNANRDDFLFLIGNPDFGDNRDVRALFVELALPVGPAVSLQVAGRYESYGRGVESTDPKLTVLWRPTLRLSVRGSLDTSFRAPSLFQAFGTQTTLAELIEPNVGNPQFSPVRTQPNRDGMPLQPEQARALDLGVSLSPIERLTLGIDYWSFDYRHVIVEQNAQALVNAAALGDAQAQSQLVRDGANGLLLRVDSFFDNAAALQTAGFDLSAAYDVAPRGGARFEVGADATYIARYAIDDPQAGAIDGVGQRNFANFGTSTPEWRVNAFVSWRRERHAVNAFVRFIDSYVDDEVGLGQGPDSYRPIDGLVTVDAQYALRFRGAGSPTLTFGAINLFDEDPPHVATSGGYDSKVHDPRGRLWYAKALVRF